MGDPIHRDLPCRCPQVRSAPLLDSDLDLPPNRLVPFVLVLVTLEELIPLMVLYAPFMLPSTCVLPSQRERILSKQRQSMAVYAASMREDFRKIIERASVQVPFSLSSLSRTELLAVSG